jgi:hypothetical protein
VNGTDTFSGSGDSTSAEDGTAPSIGWSGGRIKTIEFELTAAGGPDDTNDFALGTVSLGATVTPTVPEMLVGFAGLRLIGSRGASQGSTLWPDAMSLGCEGSPAPNSPRRGAGRACRDRACQARGISSLSHRASIRRNAEFQ